MKYVVLFRGINVGGKNRIPMVQLKTFLEKLGFSNVSTYIASGNVFLESEKPAHTVKDLIEKALPKGFTLDSGLIKVMVLSAFQVKAVVDDAPAGFGKESEKYRYDVLFLMPPFIPKKVVASIELKEGVDDVWFGSQVIYFRRLEARVTASRISKIVSKPEYKYVTIRNWNTTQKIASFL